MKAIRLVSALLLVVVAISRGQGQDIDIEGPTIGINATSDVPPEPHETPLAPTEEESEDGHSDLTPSPRLPSGPRTPLENYCHLVFHDLTYENGDGCTGTAPVASCVGFCVSDLVPHLYNSR